MEQIYQWFEYRKKTCWSFHLSYKTVVKDDWKEQEPEAELSIAHYFKACYNLFWYRLKPSLLISYTLVTHLI